MLAGTVTEIDCGESVRVVSALPARSETENDSAAVSVEVTAPPPAVAVEVAVIVQRVFEVWAIDEIAEMPAVSVKSVPAVVESDVQSSCSLPVTVNVIVADVAVAADEARVAVVGAVVSMTIALAPAILLASVGRVVDVMALPALSATVPIVKLATVRSLVVSPA